MKNVNVSNFVRAETDVAIKRLYDIVGLGTCFHLRAPTPIDQLSAYCRRLELCHSDV